MQSGQHRGTFPAERTQLSAYMARRALATPGAAAAIALRVFGGAKGTKTPIPGATPGEAEAVEAAAEAAAEAAHQRESQLCAGLCWTVLNSPPHTA